MRIGELAQQAGVTTKAIRFYETRGLLRQPPRSVSGYREYGAADVERLTFISTARRLHLRLDDIAEILRIREDGERPCDYVRQLIGERLEEIDQRINELEKLKTTLQELQRYANTLPKDDGSICPIIAHAQHMPTGASVTTAEG
ncbi:MAG: heavy metal-responsive transcriptional regulator [Firmicutes bacterium]|nr:heavy metal-responsive transcriptional regulator [Bacillota bacterium]